jgi:hypothetical protein
MKKIILVAVLLNCLVAVTVNAQSSSPASGTPKVWIDNDKIRVTEYISLPGKDVCGSGMHSHTDHGNILLTDARVKLSRPDGSSEIETFDLANKKMMIETGGKKQTISTEGVVWVKGEKHKVVNIGQKPIRFYLIETK